ncbi:MAG: hypothetical protein QMB97_11220 [Pseudomonas sp.]
MSNTRMKGSNQKRNTPATQQTSASLDAQVAQFLDNGGAIEVIPRGVSGQVFTPNKKT